ncbi:MAG: hypothetical protein LBK13_12310 [Spirochaetales bacterium]|jgi:hypothetical protein|nr:hypothetical protein [Spirochaetales bacterium]
MPLTVCPLAADEDIDSLFDEPADTEETAGSSQADSDDKAGPPPLTDIIDNRGFSFEVEYEFIAGFSPGWAETPWNRDYQFDTDYGPGKPKTSSEFATQIFAAEMNSTFMLDFRISPTLRVYQSFKVDFPNYDFKIKEFFADYNLNRIVFFRMGLHTVNWGVSRNFPFVNLPVMVPPEGNRITEFDAQGSSIPKEPGDPYAVKMDIPVGIGGLQLLTLSRSGFIEDQDNPQLKEFGYGLKYNLAFRWADIDIGSFYHNKMPFRSFMSVKSTLPFGTEIYGEGLFAASPEYDSLSGGLGWSGKNIPENWERKSWSGSIGVFDEFFDRMLTVNFEYFFNGERHAQWLKEESSFQDTEVSPFIYGHNGAANLVFRPNRDIRLFTQCLYNLNEKTAQLVPGIQITPVSNLNLYLGVPMVLGERDGTYYSKNADKKNRPFSIVLAVSFSGNYRFSYYQ